MLVCALGLNASVHFTPFNNTPDAIVDELLPRSAKVKTAARSATKDGKRVDLHSHSLIEGGGIHAVDV